MALAPTGILDGRKATCYPGFENRFGKAIIFSDDRVTADGNLITSRGPGTALEFALALAGRLAGSEVQEDLARRMLAPASTSWHEMSGRIERQGPQSR